MENRAPREENEETENVELLEEGIRPNSSGDRFDGDSCGAVVLKIPLLPSFQTTLRALAERRGMSMEHVAARLLYEAMVPDRELRRWLVRRDLAAALDRGGPLATTRTPER